MTANPIAPRALYQEVAERLRQRIYAHELSPGAWVDEQSLAEQYGISRTPLREALKVLATEGLVTLKPRRGCYVNEVSERDLDEIFSVMSLLEGQCARLTAEKARPPDVAALKRIHARLEEAAGIDDIPAFFEANQAFHCVIHEIADNRWLMNVIGDLRKMIRLSRQHSLFSEGRLEQSLNEHRAILAAIAAGNPRDAERLTCAHILSGRAALARIAASRQQAVESTPP